MNASPKWTVVKSAVASRALVIFLIVLWRSLLSPYDTSATLNSHCIGSDVAPPEIRVMFPWVATAIESSVVWDGVYFVRSSECGYEYEQSYAFLPLLPISIRFLASSVFAPLVPVIGKRAVLAFSGYVINNVAFVFAALYLYKLSVLVLKDRDAAFKASILFCFNPASIFYSSIYSESLYALLSIGGLYHFFAGRDKTGVVWLALSGAARSNGVINAGYVCFEAMHRAANAKNARRFVTVIGGAVVRSIFIFTPFMAFQAYGYVNMCVGSGDGARPWCKARIPLLYNYIQSHYWGVGFLRYFRFKQLPNFLLAAPILTLALCAIVHYVKSDPTKFFSMGFRDESRGRKQKKKTVKEWESGELTVYVIPFVVHLAFLGATAFFVMHVQVATRFLSSSPPVYWFAAYLMGCRRWGYIIWAYSIAYILLGSLLFSNFYPFT